MSCKGRGIKTSRSFALEISEFIHHPASRAIRYTY
jgi:hypothetical protein